LNYPAKRAVADHPGFKLCRFGTTETRLFYAGEYITFYPFDG